MSILESIAGLSILPANKALQTVINHKNSSCLDSIAARLLFAAQLVVSAIALPIILVVGFIATIVNAFQGEWESLEDMGFGLLINIFSIPTSILGIIAPLSVTKCFMDCLSGEERDNEDFDHSQVLHPNNYVSLHQQEYAY